MQLSRDDVEHVALLARLALTDDEIERLRTELASILENVAAFGELDLSSIPPSAQVIPRTNVMREDIAGACLPREQALANALETEDGFFRVPAVFDESDGEGEVQ
jgi:aspartyl-tRNA(Asn)/glutamyl-tRNA(Gln) amidotransferase subunit C